MRRASALLLVIAAGILCLPALASAQASISGLVQDSSGAVLPGVTVEAASPALIEKTRTAITDGAGRYSIVDLRPGTYSVTFSLSGFNTVKRDGIFGTTTASRRPPTSDCRSRPFSLRASRRARRIPTRARVAA